MRKLVVTALLIVLSVGAFVGLHAKSPSGNIASNVQTQSSTVPSNIIDHLPFTINESDVYHMTCDLTVNGSGITITANNTVLIGHGHTMTGSYNGGGGLEHIGIIVEAYDVVICGCSIRNFRQAIYCQSGKNPRIVSNILANNVWGIYLAESRGSLVKGNIVVNNTFGVVHGSSYGYENAVVDNYFRNPTNAVADTTQNWNGSKSSGSNVVHGSCTGGNYWNDYSGNDTDGDGLGEDPYLIHGGGMNYDYLPLVDTIAPGYSEIQYPTVSEACSGPFALNVTWNDNVQLDGITLEFDGTNFTDTSKINESLGFDEYYQVENRAVYSRSFTNLSLGAHYYRWFANDTSNHWNSTDLQGFDVVAVPQINSVNVSSVLEATANIACAGVNNITEDMGQVGLHFKIDGNWYAMNMSYDANTSLYSALIPAYNELANKTIQYYVTAIDKYGNAVASDVFSVQVPDWVIADLNRDGKVDLYDAVLLLSHYGEKGP